MDVENVSLVITCTPHLVKFTPPHLSFVDELSTLPAASLKLPLMLEKGIFKKKSNAGVAPFS